MSEGVVDNFSICPVEIYWIKHPPKSTITDPGLVVSFDKNPIEAALIIDVSKGVVESTVAYLQIRIVYLDPDGIPGKVTMRQYYRSVSKLSENSPHGRGELQVPDVRTL